MVGQRYFGKSSVEVTNRVAWETHDTSKTWTDGGAVRAILDKTAADLERVVTDNAASAVTDYASTAAAGLRATSSGDVVLGLRIDNEETFLIIDVPLRALIIAALTDLRPSLGLDKEAQATFSALVAMGRQLANLGATTKETPHHDKPGPRPARGS